MTDIAGSWYTEPMVLALVGALATIIAGVVAAWAALRAASRRRGKLRFQVSSEALIAGSGQNAQLQVLAQGVALNQPRLVTVVLDNLGKQDIVAAAFDRGLPIVLDFSAPVVEIIERTSIPASSAVPSLSFSGNKIELSPSLISAGQKVRLSVLIDGPSSPLGCNASVAGVDVQILNDISMAKTEELQRALAALSLATRTGISVVVVVIFMWGTLLGVMLGLGVGVLLGHANIPPVK
ncbi:hypothetical protein ACIRBX_11945 [Kitasatospora sp. NPDC096147]|uniref:hypothetical protein n=1 Tax=Kitasatospora sp. NPDC096147 TaxID=3364093 RepID=UPI0038078BCC